MEKKITKSGLHRSLICIAVIPVLLLVIVVSVFSSNQFIKALDKVVMDDLQDVEILIQKMFDAMYPGDYKLEEDGHGLRLMKGDKQINGDYSVIDSIKQDTGVDITLFYEDTRIITTHMDSSAARAVGTGVNAVVLKEVMEGQTAQFYPEVNVNGVSYFVYYAPIFHSDGSCIGMWGVGKPTEEIKGMIQYVIFPNIVFTMIGMAVVVLFVLRYSNKMISAIRKLQQFIKMVSQGNLTTELSDEVIRRNDELGEMGNDVIDMQRALRELIEKDALTQLNNRRYGDGRLRQIRNKAEISGQDFCIAIGDIDHFKKVNDTYGHEGGDVVLKHVADLFRKHMVGNGFAARWGGEEFLMVFERDSMEAALKKLEDLLGEIRSSYVQYGEQEIRVTMTFGLVDGIAEGNAKSVDELIREADERLYKGKNNGRNRIVAE